MAKPKMALIGAATNPLLKRTHTVELREVWQMDSIGDGDRLVSGDAWLLLSKEQTDSLKSARLVGTEAEIAKFIRLAFGDYAYLVKVRRATLPGYDAIPLAELLTGFEEEENKDEPPASQSSTDSGREQMPVGEDTIVDNNSSRDPDPLEEEIMKEL